MDSEANYNSGDDYVVEFLGYRFSFNAYDFEQRVTAAAVKLGLLAGNELDDDETADLVELVERDAIEEPRSALGRYLVRRWDEVSLVDGESLVYWLKKLVFRGAWLDHRVKEGKLEVGWDDDAAEFSYHDPHGGRALLELLPTPSWRDVQYRPVTVPRWYAAAGPAYLAVLLAIDTQVGLGVQLVLGAVTWLVLLAAIWPLVTIVRAQVIGVILFATVAEVIGSLIWGVYRYRLHNLPLFIPPAHGLVYLSGARARCGDPGAAARCGRGGGFDRLGARRASRCCRGSTSRARSCVPLLCVFLWRSRFRATYAGVFVVVAALELYGTSIGVVALGDRAPRPRDRRRGIRRAASRAATCGST